MKRGVSDIPEFLRKRGWIIKGNLCRAPASATYIKMDDALVELCDAFYMAGFKAGIERGAYEEMTKEDAS